jgi:tail collar domain
LKRAPFLGAAGAVLLSGCGGHQVFRALPGVALSNSSTHPSTQSVKLVPAVAETIPDSVLANPIVGEARRFDGKVAPSGWAFATGQGVPVASNPKLASILANVTSRRAASFTMPNPGFGLIVAVAGMFPSSPQVLALSARHVSAQTSLGPGAQALPFRMPVQPSPKTLAERRLITSALRVGRPSPVPMRRELTERIRQANDAARGAAFEQLSPDNRARLQAAVAAAVDGRISIHGAIMEIAPRLSGGEAAALLAVSDAKERGFGSVADAHPNAQLEAAYFLVENAITPDQANVIASRER